MTIHEYLAQEKELTAHLVSPFLDEQIDRHQSLTPGFSELLHHLKTYLLRGGKWHRPALALLGYRLAGGTEIDRVRKNVAALELLHRYLLIHDDIIDQDLTRHGGPTIERIYRDENGELFGRNTAIVAGDVTSALAYELLDSGSLPTEVFQRATLGFNQLLIETSAGWQLQTKQNFMQISEVTEADFIRGMELVSAQYSVVWPLRIGQIFAEKPAIAALDTYGKEAGIAFQIMDDILGMFGSPEKTGKPVGNDFREGKKTLLILKAYEYALPEDRAFLETTLGTQVTDAQIARAQAIITQTGSLDYSRTLAQNHADKAKESLQGFTSSDSEAISLLSELADLFCQREQ